jgi:thiamine pyrophosphate-dependent acetolactate synthase large subunit-like protein
MLSPYEPVERPAGLPAERQPPAYSSDMVADVLHDLGVRYLPVNPGSSFRGFHDSVVNHGGNELPQIILCVHEEIAVAMAHAYAKATGEVGVAAVHDLVGLMHATMAVYDAWCDGAPLLLLGGGGPVDAAHRRGIDWLHSASTQAALVRDYVKWDDEPLSTSAVVDSVLRGYALAGSAPTGPVYVTLDMDLQEQPLEEVPPLPDARRRSGVRSLSAPVADVERAVDLLVAAQDLVIVAGSMSFDATATLRLVELAELLAARCRDDHNAVAFPTAHRLNLSGGEGLLRAGAADVVLAIGVTDLGSLMADAGPATQLIDVSLRHLRMRGWANAEGPSVDVDVVVAAEPREGLDQLLAAVRARLEQLGDADAAKRAARRARIQEEHDRLRQEQADLLKRRWDETPIAPPRMVAEIWEAVRDRDWLLTLRNTRSWVDGIWEFSAAGQWLGHSGGGGVGYGPGAILGGALAARDRGQTSVAIIGDGDLHMGIGAIWTAVHYQIPTLIVVNNNVSFFNDELHQTQVAKDRGRPVENAWIGMRMENPAVDIAMAARGYGAWAEGPITDPDDLPAALRRALEQVDAGRVALLDVRTTSQ